MGLNLKLTIIKGHCNVNPIEFAKRVKLGVAEKMDSCVLDHIIFPDENVLGYGEVGGFTVLSNTELPMHLIDGELTKINYNTEFLYKEAFPGMPYISVYLQSTINGYGFTYFDGKESVRSKIGYSENAPLLEDGDPLPEELAAGPHALNSIGERYYVIDGDHVLEHELGETWVVQLIERFTGMSFSDLMMTEIDEYRLTLHL